MHLGEIKTDRTPRVCFFLYYFIYFFTENPALRGYGAMALAVIIIQVGHTF